MKVKVRWRNKYGNVNVRLRGIQFDSQKEGVTRYRELLLMESAGVIQNLEIKPRYEIIPAFTHQGTKYQHSTFTPDFQYWESDQLIVEDVKPWIINGVVDRERYKKLCKPDYVLRKKLFLMQHPEIVFRET